MKVAILVGDGMGDYPVPELGNRTILEAASIPHIRRLAAVGEIVRIQTVPPNLPPGSDVANLSLLGYDPAAHYSGRAPIEAAGAGIDLAPEDVAFRCNLVTVEDGKMKDYSAGHIPTEEARELIAAVQTALGGPGLSFHAGVSYRHLLVWRNGPIDLQTQPPHEIADQPVDVHLPRGDRAEEVRRLMEASRPILRDHPVNRARVAAGKRPATQIWLWGQGRAVRLESYAERFGRQGIVVSAVDLVRGLGRLAGLDAPVIPGATGFLDTNCENKVAAALRALETGNFAYVHLEAPDECGHLGRADLKKQAVEMFDARIVGPIWRALEARGEPYRLIVAMDHRTPVSRRGHTREPVPILAVDGPVGPVDKEAAFDEISAERFPVHIAHEWIARRLRV
ncbi:MAG: cofactor-independent phosphoglycerate mutase [Kiritimatiellae bacterium]|nr:cofactor-independent phosphoglycerate mutase [Kiritimatiellia bacterium]MDW8458885.1 cofactor-independent phosphoglycerate mutase [Verrucomicrobiota bacterium]